MTLINATPIRPVLVNCFKQYFNFRKELDWFINPKHFKNTFIVIEQIFTDENVLKFEFWSDFYYELMDYKTSPIPNHPYSDIESAYFKYIILDAFSSLLLKNGTSISYQINDIICPAIPLGGLLYYFKNNKKEIFLHEYGFDPNVNEDTFQEAEYFITIDRFEDSILNFSKNLVPLYELNVKILNQLFESYLKDQESLLSFTDATNRIIKTLNQSEFFRLFNISNISKQEIESYIQYLNNQNFVIPENKLIYSKDKEKSFQIRNYQYNKELLEQLFIYSGSDQNNLEIFLNLFNGSTPIIPLIWVGFIGDLISIIQNINKKKLFTGLKVNTHWITCIQCFKPSENNEYNIKQLTKGQVSNNDKEIRDIIKKMKI